MQAAPPWTGEATLICQYGSGKIHRLWQGWTALQYGAHGLRQRRRYHLLVLKLHLSFGRVYVCIYLARWQINIENEQRVLSLRQQAAISLLQRLLQRLRLHPASIDKKCDILAIALRQDAVADIAVNDVVRAIAGIYGMKHLLKREMIEFGQGHGQIARATSLQGAMLVDG